MTDTQPIGGLAFKAREIEELADVYFFRPLGMLFALAARALHLTPTVVTLAGTAVGIVGGALLAWPERAFIGFLVLVLHGILDSSDGQLARMTGRSSDRGRMLDGLGGYVTHGAIYAGIIMSPVSADTGAGLAVLVLVAAASNIVHALMYEYHRAVYTSVAIRGEPTRAAVGRPDTGIVGAYEAMQRTMSGRHPEVERVIAQRQEHGRVSAGDRHRYRACFYWPVRGWNVFGDNTRFYAIGVFAWLGHVESFFRFEVFVMNAALVALWFWQARADRRFLATVW